MKNKAEEPVKVSVLVPVYNAEKTLDECLKSLSVQTLHCIEIICINDGSTDESLNIIHSYIDTDPRFKVIDKLNTGYGDSMNIGLGKASGKYIGILEPDDFTDIHMYEDLYGLAELYSADIVKSCYMNCFLKEKEDIYYDAFKIKGVCSSSKEARKILYYSSPAIWSGIYRKKFLNDNNIEFLTTPGASYQDTSFALKTAMTAENIVLTDKAYVHYRADNPQSSVHDRSLKKACCLNMEYDEVLRFIREKKIYEQEKDIIKVFCTRKFKGYMWNYKRLPYDERRTYLSIFLKEMEESKAWWQVDKSKINALYIQNGAYDLAMAEDADALDRIFGLKQ